VTVWFTSDLHLGHARICELAERPFASVEEMNAELVRRWNERVEPHDYVWVLGDLCMGKLSDSLAIASRLRGFKILVPGNHDRVSELYKGSDVKKLQWRSDYQGAGFVLAREHVTQFELVPRVFVDLNHFPYHGDHVGEERYPEARPYDHGRWLLHGHLHCKERVTGERQLHVGVDAWDYAPVSAEELAKLMA
jgi:calcineurin-like phosphoesterase family protein